MNFSLLRRTVVPVGGVVSGTAAPRSKPGVLSLLWSDESGQDLIEYMLLASFIGLASVLAFQFLGSTMKSVYEGWDSNVQNQWETPSPISGS
jgi:Flp pilus assembly pilin Flp